MSKEISTTVDIRNNLQKMESQFKIALPAHIPVEKFLRTVMTAVQNTPALEDCDRKSLYSAAMRAASEGLLVDGRESAIVPFKGKAMYLPMVAGILKKVRNSGELLSINAAIVYEKDEFNYSIDSDGETLTHKPDVFSSDRGKRLGVYAIAKTKDGGIFIEVMSEDQVMAVKNAGAAKGAGPWGGPFQEEMYKKSAIKRLSKRLPMSTDLEETLAADDELYDFKQEAAPTEPPKTKSSRLSKAMGTENVEEATVVTTEPVTEEQIPL